MGLVALVVLLWGAWGLVQKRAVEASSPAMVQLVVAYVYSAAAPVIFMAMKVRGEPVVWTLASVSWSVLTAVLAASAAWLYLCALRAQPAGYVAGVTSAWPLVTLLLSWALMDEAMSSMKLLGIALSAAGGLCING